MTKRDELIASISRELQELQALLFSDGDIQEQERLGIRFPRGYIRRLSEFEERLPFIRDSILKKNIAYAFQYTDLLRWLSNWFDIGLSILSIHNKTGILIFASIAEAMLVGFISANNQSLRCSENETFKKMIECLHRESVLPKGFVSNLHWLRKERNNIHLKGISLHEKSTEYERYSFGEYNRARNIVRELNNILTSAYTP